MRNRFFLSQIGRVAGVMVLVGVALLFVLAAPQIGSGAARRAPAAESAAIPPAISYQGRLLHPTSGAP
ncbi:MAG: hypothetical protein ACK4SA_10345 [Caldilinea sp.]